MSYRTFGRLYRLLEEDLKRESGTKRFETDYVDRSPNGPVLLTVRLAAAIRFFAGGEAYDIAVMFGISHSVVFESVTFVVDAINKNNEMAISFPTNHDDQREIARGFQSKSEVGINRAVGCIDGIVIWMHKPTKEECEAAGVDESKFFCGRKHKFGLNLQAICDHKKRFIYISVMYGASASDHIAFEVSDLRQKLSEEGFLAPFLVLFGDNAYINTRFMATPYPNTAQNTAKDNYNFFHSQI